MFGAEGFPVESGRKEVHWRRDAMGKPFVVWEGAAAEWARNAGRKDAHLHVSNSHDGAAHLALVAYGEEIAGLGIDVVSLPRLRRPEKGRDFLRRFARKIMSNREHEGVLPYLEAEPEEALRVRLAAHFSLMEAASKACGTGLKIGIGLGKPTSLPMHALGAERVEPDTKLLFEGAALARLEALGAQRAEGIWAVDGEFLIAVVILLRGDS
jgi:phosphopantetheinyl transferase (holo-ACP synthase)